ncbi:MAG: hypothetical protein A2700_00465 [Candidatus Blackburnbacteria bacterium RIFCSPHIGHO2_01_FULL_44_64]|nr:MAG: hypothetical protein A2700_00465 [Candidatus Blackburnbacteria bacterium RIFCSPHIGHO2_01_FULL_44_64]OGY11909.1 MAG: hypothetical protein A3E16_03930 [Candidatus Blackburnbacteria bacterium RIFCSPHIGHO2_12_FULL_44_25]
MEIRGWTLDIGWGGSNGKPPATRFVECTFGASCGGGLRLLEQEATHWFSRDFAPDTSRGLLGALLGGNRWPPNPRASRLVPRVRPYLGGRQEQADPVLVAAPLRRALGRIWGIR